VTGLLWNFWLLGESNHEGSWVYLFNDEIPRMRS
jgi:hypothetical protein